MIFAKTSLKLFYCFFLLRSLSPQYCGIFTHVLLSRATSWRWKTEKKSCQSLQVIWRRFLQTSRISMHSTGKRVILDYDTFQTDKIPGTSLLLKPFSSQVSILFRKTWSAADDAKIMVLSWNVKCFALYFISKKNFPKVFECKMNLQTFASFQMHWNREKRYLKVLHLKITQCLGLKDENYAHLNDMCNILRTAIVRIGNNLNQLLSNSSGLQVIYWQALGSIQPHVIRNWLFQNIVTVCYIFLWIRQKMPHFSLDDYKWSKFHFSCD